MNGPRAHAPSAPVDVDVIVDVDVDVDVIVDGFDHVDDRDRARSGERAPQAGVTAPEAFPATTVHDHVHVHVHDHDHDHDHDREHVQGGHHAVGGLR